MNEEISVNTLLSLTDSQFSSAESLRAVHGIWAGGLLVVISGDGPGGGHREPQIIHCSWLAGLGWAGHPGPLCSISDTLPHPISNRPAAGTKASRRSGIGQRWDSLWTLGTGLLGDVGMGKGAWGLLACGLHLYTVHQYLWVV